MTNRPGSLSELVSGISVDLGLLASQTVALARVELSAATVTLGWSAAGLLASVIIAVAGGGALVAALVLILVALGLPAWAAATIVGVVLVVSGILGARYCIDRIRTTELGLKETRESLRETFEWLKLQTQG
jgi:hypothetical protein